VYEHLKHAYFTHMETYRIKIIFTIKFTSNTAVILFLVDQEPV
jgi:hypothetical protein